MHGRIQRLLQAAGPSATMPQATQTFTPKSSGGVLLASTQLQRGVRGLLPRGPADSVAEGRQPFPAGRGPSRRQNRPPPLQNLEPVEEGSLAFAASAGQDLVREPVGVESGDQDGCLHDGERRPRAGFADSAHRLPTPFPPEAVAHGLPATDSRRPTARLLPLPKIRRRVHPA